MTIAFRFPLGPRAVALTEGDAVEAAGAIAEERATLRALATAARDDPGDPDYEFILGSALLRSGRVADAAERFRAALALARAQPEYHFALGCALWRLGREEEAAAAFLEAASLDPADAGALTAAGASLERQGRHGEARASFEAALQADPGMAEAAAGLGIVLWNEGSRTDALDRMRQAARLRPGSADVLANLGLALIESGRAHAALAVLRRAATLVPDSAAAQLDLAEAAFAAGHAEEASQALARAARLEPTAILTRPGTQAVRDALRLQQVRAEQPVAATAGVGEGPLHVLAAAVEASTHLLRFRHPGRWVAIGGIALTLVAVSRVVPPYVTHFLLYDDVVAVARAPVETDAEVQDRLAHAIAARGLRQRVDPGRCEVTSRSSWRRIACSYEVPVELLPGLAWSIGFRIDVEEPYLPPRER